MELKNKISSSNFHELLTPQNFFLKRRNLGLLEMTINFLKFEEKIVISKLNRNVNSLILTNTENIKVWIHK